MFLEIEQLKKLAGSPQKKKIKQWLNEQGIPYISSIDGYPNVSKEYIEKLLSGATSHRPAERRNGNAAGLREMMGIK